MNPHKVTKDFEAALCEHTGAPYAVAVNSCTMALLLAVAWHLQGPKRWPPPMSKPDGQDEFGAYRVWKIEIPKRTYVGVAMSILHAGGRPTFRDHNWKGWYRLQPLPVIDSARWFTGGLFTEIKNEMQYSDGSPSLAVCVSFHAAKTLGIEQGGAILHEDHEADAWLRRARFDGRAEGVAPKDDTFPFVGWHCYPNPSMSAQGLLRLHSLPKHNDPLPNDDYPDLSQLEIFR